MEKKNETEIVNTNDSKKCKHEYVSVVYKTQTIITKYYNQRDNYMGIEESENVKIFCRNCGDNKKI